MVENKFELKEELLSRYQTLKENEPKIRIRAAAQKLDVSELELLELDLGESVIRLDGNWRSFLRRAHTLGYVMALTRNEYAVHERKGVYDNVSFTKEGSMGVAVGPDIDLRFFMSQWMYGYAVRLDRKDRHINGFQFFNQYGEAVHKIYLNERSNPLAYNQLVEKFRVKDQDSLTEVEKKPTKKKPEFKEVDEAAFQEAWLNLKDTHDFFPLLRKFGVDRMRALAMAPTGYAYQVSDLAIKQVFEQARDKSLDIMVFIGSPGCIQIHTGQVKNLADFGSWFNVMDPEFNMHLNTKGIRSCWVVRKPTVDGIVTSLEIFDDNGDLIVYCFGKRKPGKPELEEWRTIIGNIDPLSS